MSHPIKTKKFYTPQEYLALEEKAAYKSEYFDGEISRMAGGSENHNAIALNLAGTMNAVLGPRGCRTYPGDMRLLVNQNGLYTYPDVKVICGGVKFVPNRRDTVTNPVVIIEVLSKSTANYDRGLKSKRYRALNSLQAYIMIEQDQVLNDYLQRNDDGEWLRKTYDDLSQVLEITSINFALPLKQIYSQVDFSQSESGPDE